MLEEKKIDDLIYNQVKAVMKSLNLDQAQLAEKLSLTQASVSKALNGSNEKTFQRIIHLLETEYGVASLNQHLESAVGNDIAEIKKELGGIKQTLERMEKGMKELRGMIKGLEK
ncbi:helix-turn-helix domain-containing protein [Haliscomenobacter hydrossis]|uniref:Helix-turn-helix domain protein n=1 Tax=Haliscomenobacter hydrossis (strain ATCC 27775 / DSM 1100 / LMG 10767 / O) TaxID=760192 RepID=F4KWB8_HALH1|nr:helix-turn-helix transcriptional regulator [Haliscomenobacter hydrossis]AEE50268.1 helix-turn-helix domain protein [Haliscomenobacter hydrossis DSM 1100]